MLSKLISLGVTLDLDFEDTIRLKTLNVSSLVLAGILLFFIGWHGLYTHKITTAMLQAVGFLFLPSIFLAHKHHYYKLGSFIFFGITYTELVIISNWLIPGKGIELYYLPLMILLIILVKKNSWQVFHIIINSILFMAPYTFNRVYPPEVYSNVTLATVYIAILVSVYFFIKTQNNYKAQLKLKNEHLATLNQEKNDLMGIVAHDLKTPLAQIKGLIAILELENHQLNQEQLSLLKKIKEVTDNQQQQISKFLHTKALEEQTEAIHLEEFNLVETCQSILSGFHPMAEKKNISFTEYYDTKRISVYGSKICIEKVLSNLVSNAIKYSYPRTKVSVELRADKMQILLLVKDQGQGFKQEELPMVFKKNTPLSAQPTGGESSTGVGLYIVKKYVELMGGWVWLESSQGKGTTFFVKFPRYFAASQLS